MNKRLRWSKRALFAMFAIALPLAIQTYAQEEEEEEEIYELSPFSIAAEEDEGYIATTTLAGSRIRSNVRDLGASISIVTRDFLEDTGATDGESLLVFVGNLEVGGVLGNFSNSTPADSSTEQSRVNPQQGQRVRGLVRANLTRDYFQTDTPFDAYNTSRITVNRGPNSILFGLGSPGGVINNTTNKASIGSQFGEISVRFDANKGHRETLDYNKTLIRDRLAIRLNILNEEIKFGQEPAYEDDKRVYIAWDSVLLENENSDVLGKTRFRGSFEDANIKRNPPDVVPPIDRFSAWWEGIGSQEDLNRILAVPGISLSDINNAVVTNAQVMAAVNVGLATPPAGVSVEDYAATEGRFIPNTLVDRFKRFDPADRNFGGRENTPREVPYFLYPAINYNTPDAQVKGWDSPELTGIQGIMGRFRPRVTFPNGSSRNVTQDVAWSTSPYGGMSAWVAPSMDNRRVFDYHQNLLMGDSNIVQTDFTISQFVFEQELFGGRAGIEIAWDEQHQRRYQFTPFDNADDKSISIDISPHHAPGDSNFDSIADRLANENVGRPIVSWVDTTDRTSSWDQETFRTTIFGNLDFGDMIEGTLGTILGSHTLTGLYEDRANDRWNRVTRGAWWADNSKWPGSPDISNGLANNFRRHVRGQVYMGPSVIGTNSPDDLRISRIDGIPFPKVGENYGIWYFDNNPNVDRDLIDTWRIIEHVASADIAREELESTAVSLQSRFFDNHIVAMYGWREDTQLAWRRLQQNIELGDPSVSGVVPQRLDLPGINEVDGNFNEGLIQLEDTPAGNVTQDTATWSVVARLPEGLIGELPWGMDITAHYYEAESFEPPGLFVDVLNNRLPSPLGTTEEYGLTIEFFDGKWSIRFNKFETVNANSQISNERWGPPNERLSNVASIWNFLLDRITSVENDAATNLYPDGFLGFDASGNRLFEEGTDAALTPDTFPNNTLRGTGSDADLAGFRSFDDYYQAIIDAIPDELQAVRNFRVFFEESGVRDEQSDPYDGALRARQDFVATGTEIDVIGRLTDNLSISLNVAQQETVTSNTGPAAVPLTFAIAEALEQPLPNSPGGWSLAVLRDSPFQGEPATARGRYSQELRRARINSGLDGTVSPEQREWRVNATLRYDFLEGFLRGFQVGGSMRYQSEISGGYPNRIDDAGTVVPDLMNPYFGPDEWNGDLFMRYRRPLTDTIDWSIQLNARNLYRSGGSRDIPVYFQPDGTVGVTRIPNEQQFFLTNTFSF